MAAKANQAMVDRMGKERGNKSFNYLKLSKDIAAGKSETYRILPVPDDGRSYGFGRYVTEYWFEVATVPKKFRPTSQQEKVRFFDPNGCFNRRTCALTDRLFSDLKELQQGNADKKKIENAKAMLPQRYRMIVVAKRSEIDKAGKAAPIYVLSVPIKTYEAIEMRMKKHDLTSTQEGADITITRMGSGKEGTSYEIDIEDSCPLAKDKEARIELKKRAAEINLDDLVTDDSAALDAIYKVLYDEDPPQAEGKKGKKGKPEKGDDDEEEEESEDSEDESEDEDSEDEDEEAEEDSEDSEDDESEEDEEEDEKPKGKKGKKSKKGDDEEEEESEDDEGDEDEEEEDSEDEESEDDEEEEDEKPKGKKGGKKSKPDDDEDEVETDPDEDEDDADEVEEAAKSKGGKKKVTRKGRK